MINTTGKTKTTKNKSCILSLGVGHYFATHSTVYLDGTKKNVHSVNPSLKSMNDYSTITIIKQNMSV